MALPLVEASPGAHFAVSSGSFIDFSRSASMVLGPLFTYPDLHELEFTARAARKLQMGTEYVYRVRGVEAIADYADSRTVSFHWPIFASWRRFRAHGFRGLSAVRNFTGSEFVLGFADSAFSELRDLAELYPERVCVAHPDLALWLAEKLENNVPIRRRIGVEADWPSVENSPALISDDRQIVALIDKKGYVANPDTSHHSLAYNPPDNKIAESLIGMVDTYGDRIRRIHFSGNIPYPEDVGPVQWPHNSLSLSASVFTGDHLRQYHEFYTYVDLKAKEWGIPAWR